MHSRFFTIPSMNATDPTGFIDADGIEWVPAARAAALIPSPTGRPTHVNSLRRWVSRGLIRGRRQSRFGRDYLWVALDDVNAFRLMTKVPVELRIPPEDRGPKHHRLMFVAASKQK